MLSGTNDSTEETFSHSAADKKSRVREEIYIQREVSNGGIVARAPNVCEQLLLSCVEEKTESWIPP